MLRNLWLEEKEVLVRLSKRRDLPFIGAREGGERQRRELKGTREMKRTCSSRLGSFPQPAARRGAARRVVARRAAEEERAWMSLLFSSSYMWRKSLPYKEVQLPLN